MNMTLEQCRAAALTGLCAAQGREYADIVANACRLGDLLYERNRADQLAREAAIGQEKRPALGFRDRQGKPALTAVLAALEECQRELPELGEMHPAVTAIREADGLLREIMEVGK
jgi:hypothetical protein